jgi:outer membrane lipoprotein-sorting protein
MKKVFLMILLLSCSVMSAQTKDANKIIDGVKQKFSKIKDYQVDVNIKVDVNFIKMPDRKAKLFFKQPDKTKFQSEGFAMLPKQGFSFSPVQLLKGDYSAIYVRSEVIDGKKLDVIKIIPNNDSSDVVLSTLWVDQSINAFRKVETVGKKSGNITIDFKYDNNDFSLPAEVKFSFNLENGAMHSEQPDKEKSNNTAIKSPMRGPLKGAAILTYTNYKINKGIPDSFFDEKKK